MPDAIELLERLADAPPSSPRPVADLRARAAHRRRHQRNRTLAGLGLATVTVLVAVTLVMSRDEPGRVQSGPSTSSSTTVPALDESRGGLRVIPTSGLGDDAIVTVSLETTTGIDVVAWQCAAEAVAIADDEDAATGALDEWCGTPQELRIAADGPGPTMPVTRRQRVGAGTIDCAERPGRCVLLVEVPRPNRMGAPWPATPLSFSAEG